MDRWYVPVIEGDKRGTLFQVIFELELLHKTEHWNHPPIDIGPRFEPIYKNIEYYFTKTYREAKSVNVYIKPNEENIVPLGLTDSTTSVLLGIFLAAAQKIAGLEVKKCWQTVTATGTFKEQAPGQEPDGNLSPEAIGEPEKKFAAFEAYSNTEMNRCTSDEKQHLFLYVSDDTLWEEKINRNSKNFQIKAFSPGNDTLFDILDYVFELPSLPNRLINNVQKSYFDDFERKANSIINHRYIGFPVCHKKTFLDKLDNSSLFIFGPHDSGKTYLAVQLARNLIWNNKIYAPILIKMDITSANDVKSIIQKGIQNELLLLFNKVQNERKTNDYADCMAILKKDQYLIIIDDMDLGIPVLDKFLENMEEFRTTLEEHGSRIIFTNTVKYSNANIKNLENYEVSVSDTVSAKKTTLKRLQKPLVPNIKKRNILLGLFGLLAAGLVLFLFFNRTVIDHKSREDFSTSILELSDQITEQLEEYSETIDSVSENKEIITVLIPDIPRQHEVMITTISEREQNSANFIQVTDDKWKDGEWKYGEISTSVRNNIYSFSAIKGEKYHVWWNSLHRSDGTKKLAVRASAFYDNGIYIFSQEEDKWDIPVSFEAALTGTVNIRVGTLLEKNEGDYAITYSTFNKRPNWQKPSNTVPLIDDWEEGNITNSVKEIWHSFPVDTGKQYYLWLNDSTRGDGTMKLDACVSAFYENGEHVFNYIIDEMWYIPQEFTAKTNGEVYIRVYPSSSINTGNYSIAYGNNNIRPYWKPPSIHFDLNDGRFTNDSIEASNREKWYSFPVTRGNQYYLWFNTRNRSDGKKNLSTRANVYYSNGDHVLIINPVYASRRPAIRTILYAWDTPMEFIAASNDTIYITVYPSTMGSAGDYGIAISTGNRRPEWKHPSSPRPLTENNWNEDEITASVKEIWFSLDVVQGEEYHFLCKSRSDIDSTYMSAFFENGDRFFSDIYFSRNQKKPFSIKATSTEVIFIRVFPSSVSGTGTYGIKYSTDSTVLVE